MEDQKPNLEDAETLLARLKVMATIGSVGGVIVVGLYFYRFHGELSPNASDWGVLGDYIGGVLNPFYALLALIALLGTFALQLKELKISAAELKRSAESIEKQNQSMQRQTFESTFFQMLRLHHDIVESIDLTDRNNRITKGRDCLKVFLRRLTELLKREGAAAPYDAFRVFYDEFFKDHHDEIGHYFRHLYHIFRFIHRSEMPDKQFYASLVRAQLSSVELQLLYYNCLSAWGSEKFKPMVEHYSLLKSMPTEGIPGRQYLSMYSPNAFGGSYPTNES